MTKRCLGEEIFDAIQDIKEGKGKVRSFFIPQDIKMIRKNLNLSQLAFASLMGVSFRTLQEWEQGRRKPSGPATSLLRVADKHPEAFLDL